MAAAKNNNFKLKNIYFTNWKSVMIFVARGEREGRRDQLVQDETKLRLRQELQRAARSRR